MSAHYTVPQHGYLTAHSHSERRECKARLRTLPIIYPTAMPLVVVQHRWVTFLDLTEICTPQSTGKRKYTDPQALIQTQAS